MKYAKYPLILLFAASMAACGLIFEKMDHCYSTIRFSYTADDGNEAWFGEKIGRVDLYVFDEEERLVRTHTLTPAELASRSARLILPPGRTYHAVAIGNAHNYNPYLLEGGEIDDMKMHHHATHPDNGAATRSIDSQDHLYHGSMMDITVPPAGNLTTEPIAMNASHFDMAVTVKGYIEPGSTTTRQGEAPLTLEHNNVPSWLDFDNKHSKHDEILLQESTSHFPQGEFVEEGYRFVYNVLRHEPTFDDDSDIILRDAAGNVVYSMSSAQFIADNEGLLDLTLQEVLVAIDIEFTPLGVEVYIPEWAIIEAKPEF